MNLHFSKWLERLLEEKEIDAETISFELYDSNNTYHFMPLSVILEYIKSCDPATQRKIKTKSVQIDFYNGDITHFFKYIGQWIANSHPQSVF